MGLPKPQKADKELQDLADQVVFVPPKPGEATKYYTNVKPNLHLIEKWLEAGVNVYSICEKIDIKHSSWAEYKQKHLEITECISRACIKRNDLVVNALFKKSLGEKVSLTKQKVTNQGEVIAYKEEQYVPGDVNAQKFWLINRANSDWKPEAAGHQLNLTQNNINIDAAKEQVQQLLQEYQKAMQVTAVDCTPEQLEE